MLAHPHTSAGRVPTDDGYRHYVDALLEQRRDALPAVAVAHDGVRSEIDEALRETAEALSRVTELLAVVSAPAVTTSTIRHIEVLALQPRLVMVVIITTSGQVTKRIFHFAAAVDEGLAEFARVYLNERLVGVQLGTRRVGRGVREHGAAAPRSAPSSTRSGPPSRPSARRRRGLARGRHLAPAGEPGAPGRGRTSTSSWRCSSSASTCSSCSPTRCARTACSCASATSCADPSLQACSLVAANYGVANRNLGTVSVLGPTRMDYQRVIATVRATADDLSRYLEEIW